MSSNCCPNDDFSSWGFSIPIISLRPCMVEEKKEVEVEAEDVLSAVEVVELVVVVLAELV